MHVLTQVRSPHEVFFAPQRFVLPLFQRPYVWSAELQWEPLWQDIVRLVEAVTERPTATHFMGAIVLQQQNVPLGGMQAWTVIDGQQRLTTLQILLDALHAELVTRELPHVAGQLIGLIENEVAFRLEPEHQFKLWPTNRDRASFAAVMGATPPIDYAALGKSRIAQAHEFFTNAVRSWLDATQNPDLDARKLVATITTKLQLVAIQLQADEDAQEIFETLNARGTPLSAADLIKNFVFQRLELPAAETERAYRDWWAQFETPFWESEVRAGRIMYTRSSLFLTQWLTARTMQEIPAREVFASFKRYAADLANGSVQTLLPAIHAASERYKTFMEQAAVRDGEIDRLALFVYRTGTLDSELTKPLLIWLGEPAQADIPVAQRDQLLATLESWFVRRALIRAPSQGANRFLLDLLTHLATQPHDAIASAAEAFLAKQQSGVGYWPDDAELRMELTSLQAYKRFRRGRLRMVLEAIEDHRRGYPNGNRFGERPVSRGVHTIEHIMPQEWRANWGPLDEDLHEDRDRIVQTLGNLTLATQPLNSRLSNAAWSGPKGKREALEQHSSLLITRGVVNDHRKQWAETDIEARTQALIDLVISVWPVPEGHRRSTAAVAERVIHRVEVADLIRAGILHAGTTLQARPAAQQGRTATLGQDGSIHVDGTPHATLSGTPHATLSGAAKAVSGNVAEAGWHFWGLEGGQALTEVRAEYLAGTDDEDSIEDD